MVYSTTFEMVDIITNLMGRSAVFLNFRIGIQFINVFVVTVYEQYLIRFL